MDLVNIRKRAKKEQEKEEKTQETTLNQVQGKTEETKEEPIEEVSLKHEPEEVEKTERTETQEKVEGPTEPFHRILRTGAVEIAEKIKSETPLPVHIEEEAEVEIVSFQLGEETYGVKIDCVKEILKPLQITPVPRTPDYLTGVTSLRGEIIPVFDFKKRLGLEGPDEGKKRRILVLLVRNETMGALIDEVKGVVKLPRESIGPPPTIITGVEADFLEGVSRIDNRFIGLLNIEEVMKI
jgi:purine-binding chemotaxis protein CheW